jgi:hypothetical protein
VQPSRCLLICLAALAGRAPAQSFTAGTHRDLWPGRETPRPQIAGVPEMAFLHGTAAPAGFMLRHAGGDIFGPFEYRDGARVGSDAFACLLRPRDAGSFELEDPRDGARQGPLAYRDGTVVTFGTNRFTVLRLPSRIAGSCRHAGARAAPVVALAPWRETLLRPLLALRENLLALEQRVEIETAPVVLEGVPTIRGPRGHRRDNVIARSKRDVEAGLHAADVGAGGHIERFMRDHMTKLQVAADGAFASPPLAPGTYLLCAMTRLPASGGSARTSARPAIWWTLAAVGPHEIVSYTLTAENAIDWRAVFPH